MGITKNTIWGPPLAGVPITDPAWASWLTQVVWPIIGGNTSSTATGPQGVFGQLQIGKAVFTTDYATQELLHTNQGLYVDYSSSINNIIYGFACNVTRSGGAPFVVAAQLNAWNYAPGGVCQGVFGAATQATTGPNTGSNTPLVGIEPDPINMDGTNVAAKWGCNPVFKNRFDNATSVTMGVSSNFYNYFSCGFILTSQARSNTGELCGWTVGLQFLDKWCDQFTPQVWSSTASYPNGAVVSYTGVLWKSVAFNKNSAPSGANANWIQYALNTTGYAVGIDFSPLSTTTMARMWSAIRLRNTMVLHWEETGAVGTYMDAVNSRMVVCGNYDVGTSLYVRQLQVDVTNGNLWVNNGITGLGGGVAPTLGTIGGSGPATAAQRGWYKIIDGTTGNPFWVPVWQ